MPLHVNEEWAADRVFPFEEDYFLLPNRGHHHAVTTTLAAAAKA
jgi:hypothetical protein